MEMEPMDDLKYMLREELKEIARKGEISSGDLEKIYKLTSSVMNICKIGMLEGEDEGYSRSSYYRNSYNDENSYGNGASYTDGSYDGGYSGRRGMHYVRGHYSRGRGRYSYADGKEDMMEQIRSMMNEGNMSGNDKAVMQKAIDILERS